MLPTTTGGQVRQIAALIDHTLLKPQGTAADIRRLCQEARQYEFAAVCVNPYWVPVAARELAASGVSVATVAGFPLGANTTAIKVAETEAAIAAGALEIDMVLNIGELCGGNLDAVRADIAAVVSAAHARRALVKVILETGLLNDHQKIAACTFSQQAGADFVKTSTGFSTHGATVHDVALMRRTVGPDMGVKASGGIRTLEDLEAMCAAGATRIGTSSGVHIVEALQPALRGNSCPS
jgi:deoxyribose-phosphate aldolase